MKKIMWTHDHPQILPTHLINSSVPGTQYGSIDTSGEINKIAFTKNKQGWFDIHGGCRSTADRRNSSISYNFALSHHIYVIFYSNFIKQHIYTNNG